MKGLFKGCLTIPNLLSLMRIIIIPFFAVLFYKGEIVAALILLFISGLSDFFDGKIARKFNQISALGKILDPVADKLTQITLAVMLYIEFRIAESSVMRAFGWVFLVFLIKEAVMVVGGGVMLLLNLRPGAAEIYGKVSTFVFYGVMLLIIGFGPEVGLMAKLDMNLIMPEWLTIVLVIISAILTLVAFFSYMPETYRQFKERFSKKDLKEN